MTLTAASVNIAAFSCMPLTRFGASDRSAKSYRSNRVGARRPPPCLVHAFSAIVAALYPLGQLCGTCNCSPSEPAGTAKSSLQSVFRGGGEEYGKREPAPPDGGHDGHDGLDGLRPGGQRLRCAIPPRPHPDPSPPSISLASRRGQYRRFVETKVSQIPCIWLCC